jgi:hypothetical protein
MEWLRKFFHEPGTAIVMLTGGVLGLLVGIANGVIQKRYGGWSAFFASAASGTVIGIVAGLASFDYVKSETMRYAIIAICAIISDDIWAGLRTLGASVKSNPIETFFRVLDALRGRSVPPAVTPAPGPAPKEE